MGKKNVIAILGCLGLCVCLIIQLFYHDDCGYQHSELSSCELKITGYVGHQVELIVPQTLHNQDVRAIGDAVFYHQGRLRSVILLDNIEYLGVEAFCGCRQLLRVHLGGKIVHLYPKTFLNCVSLGSINLENIRIIDRNAFESCRSLSVIDLPLVESIGTRAFLDCINLRTISLGRIVELYEETFKGCLSLQEIYLPKSLKKVQENAFLGCMNLRDIYYEGSFKEWQNVDIMDETLLSQVQVHFNVK